MPAERTPLADDSLFVQPLLAVTKWSLRAPRTVLTGAFVLALLAIGVSLNGLSFKSSRLDLLNPHSEYNRRWLAYLAEFGSRDDAVIVVRSNQPTQLTAAIDALAAQLHQQPALFESIFSRRDLSALKGKALHYLPPAELARIEQQVQQAVSVTPPPGHAVDLVAPLAALNDRIAHAAPASPEQYAQIEAQYTRAAGLMLAALSTPEPTLRAEPAPLPALSQFDPQYLLADKGQIGFVLLRLKTQPGEASPALTAIERLRGIIKSTQAQHSQAWIGLTGMPVIEHDEMAASQFDMLWTSILSMALVLLLYLASYGGLRHALLVNVLLLLATAYSFGFVTIAVGHLNILSAAFSAVLIGLGIDFAIHYVASYLKLRQEACSIESALLRTAVEVGPGVVTGGITTAAAFFMAAMTDFIGVRELGLVAGGGIVLCVLTTIIVLPPLVLLVDRRWPLARLPTILPAGHWLSFPLRQPRLVVACCVGVTLALASGASQLRYDHNLLNLQPRHLESAEIERELCSRLDDSVWYAVSLCSTSQELQLRKAQFEKLPVVAKTEEIASLVPTSTPAQARRIAELCHQLSILPQQPPELAPLDVPRLKKEVASAIEALEKELPYESPAGALLARLQAALTSLPPAEVGARLTQGQAAISFQAISGLAALQSLANPAPPQLADLPRELTDRFIGANGLYLLKVYARGNIWNMNEMETFVRAVESVDPRVTGHPVQTFYASRQMQESFLWAGLYALVAVVIILWIDFRNLAHSLLAMTPLALGFLQMCGLIGWLDIPLNPANMIVLPLILGIGVDHGVHLVHHWRQQKGPFTLGDSTTLALLLTAATTTASFGALILARHQGLQSLGQVLTLGVTTCLASSIIFFPAVLTWLSQPKSATHIERPRLKQPMPEVIVAEAPVIEEQSPITPVTIPQQELAVVDVQTAPASSPLLPAEVTEEEIAALLDSALIPPRLRAFSLDDSTTEEEAALTAPRQRHLPRRNEAA